MKPTPPANSDTCLCPMTANDDVVALIPALRGFARSLCRNGDNVDDLVQETLVKAIANLDKYRPNTRLKSWLFTIMRNTFCTRIKVTTREAPGVESCVSILPWTAESQEWAQRGREVARAIDLLPDEQREAIVSVCIKGGSYQEAADTGCCEIGTIKSRISRARANLAAELGDDNAEQAADANAVIRLR
jgi:RNA polymerase sigma factor (sigma-70 family)